ncbi:MAG: DUF433 domain-containing protein [Elusimicrobia bacterium]|nr:DUF433 domain-containing protein [Elusimicrobiota bacterium]
MTFKVDSPTFEIAARAKETSGDGDSFLLLAGGGSFLSRVEAPSDHGSAYLIGKSPLVCGGAPIVIGTRVAVHHLVEALTRLGDRAKLLSVYPHLSTDQVAAALAYYRDHSEEIEELIAEDQKAEFSNR